MRFLDLDLDFFMHNINHWRALNSHERPSAQDNQAFSPEECDRYLTENLGLSKTLPIPGKFVINHVDAFAHWKSLICDHHLVAPFDVVHVDAHADLGLGEANWVKFVTEHMHLPISERSNPTIDQDNMTSGNYLTYALSCGWIRSLTYVHNEPRTGRGGNDLMSCHFKNFTSDSKVIELKACKKSESLYYIRCTDYEQCGVISTDPEIPFDKVPASAFRNSQKFNFALLCQSPEFTPSTCDDLIPIIGQYIKFL